MASSVERTALWREGLRGEKVSEERRSPWREGFRGEKVVVERTAPWREGLRREKSAKERESCLQGGELISRGRAIRALFVAVSLSSSRSAPFWHNGEYL